MTRLPVTISTFQFLVRNNSSIIESFEEYIRPDLLEGDNKFDAGDFGKILLQY